METVLATTICFGIQIIVENVAGPVSGDFAVRIAPEKTFIGVNPS
ncbi:hypothetical protein [Breoghania sp.]|nr:hypothetical protein [Breoghania sp.]MDJ0931463.1 hypothetical protein [Breoghania sp.]